MAQATENEVKTIPQHVAVIMDGNGRWAKSKNLNRLQGHNEGVLSVLSAIETATDLGIKYLTLYTFSTENWNRPQDEVSGLMDLLVASIQFYTDDMIKKGVRMKFIGDRDELSEDVQKAMADIEAKTAHNTVITVMPALNYGGRREILHGVKKIASEVRAGALALDEITEDLISKSLYTSGIPDPDLLIRTSGEMRLSNFLLWQLSYAEIYISDTYWPDFREVNFKEAIDSFKGRSRRFGGVDAKV
jgi:undecaprenyl diphosphate synthase